MKRLFVFLLFVFGCSTLYKTDPLASANKGVYKLSMQTGSNGTGFAAKTAKGNTIILTAGHVCEFVGNLAIASQDGEPVSFAQAAYIEPISDVCIMEVDNKKLPTLSVVSASGYDGVIIKGHPEGIDLMQDTPASECGARVVRKKEGGGEIVNGCIADVKPGNSGSPVLNSSGEVVGLISTRIEMTSGKVVGGYTPSNIFRKMLDLR